MSSLAIFLGRIACALVAVACGSAAVGPAPAALGASLPHRHDAGRDLLLDLTPMTSATSLLVMVERPSRSRVVRYDRHLLEVMAVEEGELTGAAELVETARRALASPGCPRRDPARTGVRQGDQFRIIVGSAECVGFVDDAAGALRSVLDTLRETAAHGVAAPVSRTYLRAELLDAAQVERVRAQGSLRVLSLQELPEITRDPISATLRRPFELYAVGPEARNVLLDRSAPKRQLVVVDGPVRALITVFDGRIGKREGDSR